ncbi:MAG: hypothetical protein IPL83_03815 [Bdellovibrionales bacterium]|nr:hypothetical protein [Bdellovibrionales bacterium]
MKNEIQRGQKKILKKKVLVISIGAILTVLFIALSFLFGYKYFGASNKSQQPKVDASYLQLRPSFHPDSVLNLKYQKGTFIKEFHRQDRDGVWQPEVYPQRIQGILNLLAQIHFEKLPSDTDYESVFTIQFSDSQVWRAGWKGTSLKWIDGSMKGYGTQLIPSHLLLMYNGTNTFFPREYSWCKSRPSKFEFLADPARKKILVNSNGSWKLSGYQANANNEKLLTNKIENWLSLFCQLEITQAIDNEYMSHFEFLPKLKITFSNKESFSIEQSQYNTQVFMFDGKNQDGQLILLSAEFAKAFAQLMDLVSLK